MALHLLSYKLLIAHTQTHSHMHRETDGKTWKNKRAATFNDSNGGGVDWLRVCRKARVAVVIITVCERFAWERVKIVCMSVSMCV